MADVKSFEINGTELMIKDEYARQQLDNIANKTIVENGKLYLVRKDGTKIDTGTTLPTGGEVTDEQVQSAVTNYLAENPIEVGNGNDYKYEYIGMPFPAQDVYQAWAIAGVQYDKSLDKIMCLVSDADGHSNATKMKLTLYSLNPQTSEISEIKVVREGDLTSPTINIHDAFRSQRGFLIDNDTGIYYKFHFGDDKIPKACKSEDKGVTWTDIPITETNSSSILFAGGNGQIIKTSSGRIICGLFGNGFAYTDDYFQNLTYVTSGRIASGGASKIHEYEIIELEENELVALCRYSWNPTADGNWSANESAYLDEMAWITYSHDNGTTWTVPVATNMRMDATNCCSFIDENNIAYVNLFIGTRFFADGTTTFKNGMYFLKVSKDDLKNNNLKTGELMFYGNSQFYSDFGNLACCVDCRNNVHLFYNDGKESGTCRWHYIKGSKTTVNNSNIQENPTNKEIQTYNAMAIDNLKDIIYSYVNSVRNELLVKIGELPDSGDIENPTYWTTEGLISLIETKETDFDSSTGKFKPIYGSYDYDLIAFSSEYGNGGAVSTTYQSSVLGSNNMSTLLQDLFVNSTDGFTIELDHAGYDGTGNTAKCGFMIGNINNGISGTKNFNWAYSYEVYPVLYNKSSFSTNKVTTLYTGSSGNFDKTRNRNVLSFCVDRINEKSYIAINGNIIHEVNKSDATEEYSYDIKDLYDVSLIKGMSLIYGKKKCLRFYNKALTADELKLNANYSNTLAE